MAAIGRDQLNSYQALFSEAGLDDYHGDVTPAYAAFTADAANLRPAAELLAAAADNPLLLAFAHFDVQNRLQVIFNVFQAAFCCHFLAADLFFH